MPKYIWALLYIVGGTLAIAEWFQLLSTSAYYVGFLVAIIGSILLLFAHFIYQKDYRKDILLLVLAIAFIMVPSLIISIFFLIDLPLPIFTQGGSFIAFPAIPGMYFYVAYRRQFQQQRKTIKRITTLYIGAVLLGILVILALSVMDVYFSLFKSTLGTGILVIIVSAIIGLIGFSPFVGLPALAESKYSVNRKAGELEIRANDLLSLYLFIFIFGAVISVCIVIVNSIANFPGKSILIGIMAMLLTGISVFVGYMPFKNFVDRRILGTKLPQVHLLEIYSDRITTSLDKSVLIDLINDEVLSSLFVRQAALLQIKEKKNTKVFCQLGITTDQIPGDIDISLLLTQIGRYQPLFPHTGEEGAYHWIRLILPLSMEGEIIGLWLLGDRDPDDYYSPEDISVLQSIANQTAIALVNIEQADRLRALYTANIERNEMERSKLARGLHDEVLSELAVLPMRFDELPPPSFKAGFQAITDQLRRMISGLRPAMLDYGLPTALEELVDTLLVRADENLEFETDILATDIRYDEDVELHIYRIIQQACENAFRHSQATWIKLWGSCNSDEIQLTVEDNGIGFASKNYPDFKQLLTDKRYGIIGMYERAEIIGAKVQIYSNPGEGTKISVTWPSNDLD